jgi:hypothetical protein
MRQFYLEVELRRRKVGFAGKRESQERRLEELELEGKAN